VITSRVLPVAEWTRLAGTELELALPYLPLDAQIVVIEDDATIVGCWAVVRYVHVEGVWIHPEYRRQGAVARRLLGIMGWVARSVFGAQVVITGADSDEVAGLITRLGGQRLPGTHYVIPVKEA
jgi:hypothetical protein